MCKKAQIRIKPYEFVKFSVLGKLALFATFLNGQVTEPVPCYEEVNGVLGVEAEHFALYKARIQQAIFHLGIA